MGTSAKPSGEPGWKWRRIIIFPVVGFCLWRLMSLENGYDSRTNDALIWGYQVMAAILVLAYTGLATVQDVIAIWRTRSGLPYSADTPASSDASITAGTVVVNNTTTTHEAPPADPQNGLGGS